ncbi:FG-GAP-like repeat-containing protein [Azospirillum argentinense]
MGIVTGTSADDTLLGGSASDILEGLDGNDYLDGGIGVDTLNGGSGDDTLVGSSGDGALSGDGTFGNMFVASHEFAYSDGWMSQSSYQRTLGDVNGDGRADIIGFGSNNVRVALGQADGTFAPDIIASSMNFATGIGGWSSQNQTPLMVGDVNGDGRADIIGFGYNNVRVALGQADGTFAPDVIASSTNFATGIGGWSSQNQTPRMVGDVNGDGRVDIIGFGSNNVRVALGQADGTFGKDQIAYAGEFGANNWWTTQDLYPRFIADVNGDGRADIVGFGSENVKVALGRADGTFEAAQVGYAGYFGVNYAWTSQNECPRAVADVNGDGCADIIGFGGMGNVRVALGRTDGTFATEQIALSGHFGYNSGWITQDQFPRMVADVNGDGLADIVGFGQYDTYVSLANIAGDCLAGGQGDDTYLLQTSSDQIIELANEGIDEVRVSFSSYTLSANLEHLTYTGAGAFAGTGNELGNRITGNANGDTLVGQAGDDTLDGGGGADTLIGGTGNDTYIVDQIGDVIVENVGEGTDEVRTGLSSYTLMADVENLVYTGTGAFTGNGNTSNNAITGGVGDDSLTGGAGNDTLDGGTGADTLIGGAGDDVYLVDDTRDVVRESVAEGIDEVRTTLTTYTLGTEIERLTFIGIGNFKGTGNTLNNLIVGGAGNDTLTGGAGADTLIGGDGDDRFYFDDADAPLQGGAGFDTAVVQGNVGASLDLAACSIEQAYGGGGNDSLIGTGAFLGLAINGRDGDDLILGSAFNDTLTGGNGSDTLIAGDGDDVLYIDADDALVSGGAGFDTVYVQGDGNLTLDLTASGIERVFSGSGNDILTATGSVTLVEINGGAGDDLLVGSAFDDTLRGDAGDDTLFGGAGNDVLVGGGGNNVLFGGAGDDRLYVDTHTASLDGGAGNDTVYARYSGGVTLDLSASIELFNGSVGSDTVTAINASSTVELIGGDGDDSLTGGAYADSLRGDNGNDWLDGGDGNDTLSGGNGNDWLCGGSGNDTLSGGSGNDTLVGGFGDDSLVGGSGADLFVFSNGGGNDILRDFNAGQGDLIGLAEGQTYTLATDMGGNARIVFGASDTVTLVGVQITAVSSSWFVTV